MSILRNLNSRLKIEASEEAASTDDINSLKEFSSIELPLDYCEIVVEMTEVEILVDSDRYFRVWSPDGCIEMNEEYQIQKYIPQSLAIGDDEGGGALIMMTGEKGFGLYKVDFGDLDIEDAEYISDSLRALLVGGIGLERL
ncbi:TPA: SMI1/KNR4 family protein [Photobacterium damselae]|uniref:SMI1/KNR4 family protein n=1 Tax=Photobacterium damselae TaxID=38293 RepID=UPI001302DCBF|nr:SMI1/KNR4 family protein [Photobacterium damselae]NVH46699.1 SMI1/KNR4 family protein [Photobacterium damselae subsp. damselae]UKA20232.1 SMI1/KNR4 family protein [Photobacterium damselae subsp. damselae]